MRFLIDACAGRTLAEWHRAEGHDVVESHDRGPDPGEALLLTWAAEESRVLVTMDKDFGRLLFRDRQSHSGLIRLPDVPAANRVDLMKQILLRCGEQLNEGAIVTVRGDRVRDSRVRDIN